MRIGSGVIDGRRSSAFVNDQKINERSDMTPRKRDMLEEQLGEYERYQRLAFGALMMSWVMTTMVVPFGLRR